jgi:hypothetical protein
LTLAIRFRGKVISFNFRGGIIMEQKFGLIAAILGIVIAVGTFANQLMA